MPEDFECKGCGACCEAVGRPPFAKDELGGIPEELRLPAVELPRPCAWLTKDKLCAHYEQRPRMCREFEYGGTTCLYHRHRVGK